MNLSKKIGPLPAWAWLAIGVAGVVAGLWLKNRLAAGQTSASSSGSGTPASSNGTSYPDLGGAVSGGGASGVAAPTYGPSDVITAYEQGLGDSSASLGNTLTLLGTVRDFFGSTPSPDTTPPSPDAPTPVPSATATAVSKAAGSAAAVVATGVNKAGTQFRVLSSGAVEEKAVGGTWYTANKSGKLPAGAKRTG